jgi:hypothetical protein
VEFSQLVMPLIHVQYGIFSKAGKARVNVTLRCFRVTIVAVEIPLSITYSECVSVTLVIQPAQRMRLSGCAIFLHVLQMARFSE